MHHVENFVVAPALVDKVEHLSALKVRNDDLSWIVGPDKTPIKFRDRKQFLFANRNQDFRRDAISPPLSHLRFFVYRKPLGEPARHAIICRIQNENVAHLMPQRLAPVIAAGWAA